MGLTRVEWSAQEKYPTMMTISWSDVFDSIYDPNEEKDTYARYMEVGVNNSDIATKWSSIMTCSNEF